MSLEKRWWRPIAPLFVVVLAAAVPSASAQRLWQDPSAVHPVKVQTLPDFVDLAASLSPTVVNISTQSASQSAEGGLESPEELPFFGSPSERFSPHSVKSLGSGFIINRAGYILTNDHVVEDAREVVVTLTNGRNYNAKVVGHDSKTDIALLKIDAGQDLPPAPLGDSDHLRVGEWVMAIGNPFGFDHSVTAGIVSAKARFIPGSFNDYIQTDASINPGNSGGPLINLEGAVVGVNSAIYTRTGSNMGIGFAVPINLVKEELGQLRASGKVSRGWLGVYIQKVTAPLSQSLGLSEPGGALVAEVLKNGPAMAAGLKRGDVIVSFDNKPIRDSQELPLFVGETPIGRKVMVKFIRDRTLKQVPVTITPSREDDLQKTIALGQSAPSQPTLSGFGLNVEDLTPGLARELGMQVHGGVVVTEVQPGSSADEAGLHRRDIILEVNRKPVKDVHGYQQALAEGGARAILLLVKRADSTIFVPLQKAG